MIAQRRPSKITAIVYIVAGMLSIMLAIVVLTVPALFGPNDNVMRFLFVGLLLLYGGWRLAAGLKHLKQQDQNPTI